MQRSRKLKQFHVFGSKTICPRRRLDVQKIYNYFKHNNWDFTDKIKDADIIVFYTCGGFSSAEKEAIYIIKQLLKKKFENSMVIITGCLTKINPSILSKYDDCLILPYQQFSAVDDLINAKIKFNSVQDANINIQLQSNIKRKLNYKIINRINLSKRFIRKFSRYIIRKIVNRNKIENLTFTEDTYNIMISRGCLGNCTYCAIKLAHGKLKSKPIKNILNEFKQGLEKGYTKFVLIGEDVGCYGLDIDTNVTILLRKIFEHKHNFKLIINDFNPQWLIRYYDQLLPIFQQNIDRIQDLRMPIQSGSNRILKLMKRPYTIEQVKTCLRDLKEKLPQLKIYTHVLVGFPSESEEDFNKSVQLIEEFNFEEIGIYLYDDRPMTESFHMKNKIPSNIINKRANMLN